jgi:hypothetical protein
MLQSSLNAPLIGDHHSSLTWGAGHLFGAPDALTPDGKRERCDADFAASQISAPMRRREILTLLAGVALGAPNLYHVSQKGRAFQPGEWLDAKASK